MATKKATTESVVGDAWELHEGVIRVNIIGRSPLIYNAMPEKAKHTLLLPAPTPNRAERAMRLKHNPIEEFRASVYKTHDPDAPTILEAPASWFKKGMLTAALRTPFAKKTEAGQLITVDGPTVSIYGVPEMLMRYVRSADMARTPDLRTRAILRNWACSITVRWLEPLMNEKIVGNLLMGAGLMSGCGDWRTEKGNSDFGQYGMVAADDPQFARIVAHGARDAQTKALETPGYYDDETEQLYTWFNEEIDRRGLEKLLSQGQVDEEEVA